MVNTSIVVLLSLASVAMDQLPPMPANGKKMASFEKVDHEIRAYMELARCQAATVAVARNGTLLYRRGYGWRDESRKIPTPPDALFRIGSVTKPITAALIKELHRTGKLKLDTKVYELLALTPAGKGRLDPQWKLVTVAHLLEHQGGWDAHRTFDPVFRHTVVQRELRLTRAVTPTDVVRWMMGRPLDFEPGTRTVYSNFGYCLLGRVVERVTKQSFEDALREQVLKPAHLEDIRVGRTARKYRPAREVSYPVTDSVQSLEVLDSCAGMIASAPALCGFLHHYWINGDRREPGQRGEGRFFGNLAGTTAVVQQRRDGIDVAVLFNNRRDRFVEQDQQEFLKKLNAALDRAILE